MDLVLIILVSFGASWLTFFCGFGLGTLLTPVFYLLFQDLTLAIASTAIVHFANNIFKFALMQKSVDWKIALPFGIAALPFAAIGAFLLLYIDDFTVWTYQISDQIFNVNLLNLIFGSILIILALVEIIPAWSIRFSKQKLWIGGAISGFFGGLSGHQGALRSAFLIKYQLKPEVFVATGIVVALAIDIVRSTIYFTSDDIQNVTLPWNWIVLSLIAAFAGAITGKFLLKKIKLKSLNLIVSIAMISFGLVLIFGILT
ncbi:sulfite exporter TauE/SafE family protein [Crocinitomix catalasitica]|uniref:sulfite exporter TauE/SafE family protein n=1 Tax=Crocinitomix catalasitica TaxID=184607 RepID=UPI0004817E57|nr:sulfite exporter TauE/SafE family protein [Crocinitomix catalasitica]